MIHRGIDRRYNISTNNTLWGLVDHSFHSFRFLILWLVYVIIIVNPTTAENLRARVVKSDFLRARVTEKGSSLL